MIAPRNASVAQLDRVLPSEGRGRGFESRRMRQILASTSQHMLRKPLEKPALMRAFLFLRFAALSTTNLSAADPVGLGGHRTRNYATSGRHGMARQRWRFAIGFQAQQ